MQLSTARLCLDCDEVHDAQVCPVCASETFAFLSRWVPAPPPTRARAEPKPPEEADVYRRLIDGEDGTPRWGRLAKRGLIGLTAVGLFGWAWRSSRANSDKKPTSSPPTAS
jgi:hypothetical protein